MSETWVWNASIGMLPENYTISFVSNNKVFNAIHFVSDLPNYMAYDSVTVVTGDLNLSNWTNEAYRTITFSTAPTGDLLTYLQANAVKQSTGGVLA